MSMNYNNNPELYNHRLKQQSLVFQANIVANATPADKKQASDIPGVAYLRTQGLTAAADAVENIAAQVPAATDSTGVFAILLDLPVAKIYEARVISVTTGTMTVAAEISTAGNLILECDSNQDLSSQSISFIIEVKYMEQLS